MPPKNRGTTTVYRALSPEEGVLNNPAMYAGSVEHLPRKEWQFNGKSISQAATHTPYALIHCFKETLSNAGDNRVRSIEQNYSLGGDCVVTVKGNTYTVYSEGLPVAIERDPNVDNRYIPDYIFSRLLSGSSFEDKDTSKKRKGGGRHGLGGKICNIFSTRFRVRCGNRDAQMYYEREWYNRKTEMSEEIVKDDYIGPSFVEVTVELDMTIFKYPTPDTPFAEDTIDIFRWVAASMSFACDMPIIFNGVRFDYSDPKKYAALYTAHERLGKCLIHTEPGRKVIIFDTPGNGRNISFANSIITHAGGVHLNNAIHELTKGLTGEKKELDVRYIKPHVTIIVAAVVEEPDFDNGQIKSYLQSPTNIHFSFSQQFKDSLKKWHLVKAIETQYKIKAFNKEEKESSKLEKLGKIKGEDANWSKESNWKLRSQTVCSLLEGTSAAEYEKRILDYMVRGRDRYGAIELRGKPKNVMKSDDLVLIRNKEIRHIIKRIGLDIRADYSDEKVFRTLRYGRLRIMADPDPDGFHICGLIIAFFHHYFPSLLKRGDFVYIWFRPKIQVTHGKSIMRFYTTKEYDDWTAVTPGYEKWTHRYFKGLGGCTPDDIKLDFESPREILARYDEKAAEKIALSFGKKNDRAEWISEWSADDQGVLPHDAIDISSFIDWYIREYSHETLRRNLPGIDGLTRVRRKIIHTAFDGGAWGRKCGKTRQIKISPNFAGDVGKFTHYHQGDSIPGAIIGMAQDFVGSNNLPFFKGFGAFGNIDGGGSDASQPRYLEVLPSPLLPLIFRPEDDNALTYCYDEGDKIEPAAYAPIIPILACNGASAIGMGSSSTFANYHPLEIIDVFIEHIRDGTPFPELEPWVRGHHGLGEVVGDTFYSYGVIENATATSCVVTQLPIGMWNRKYAKRLLKLIEDGHISENPITHCTATQTRFTLSGIKFTDAEGKPRPYTYEDLGLVQTTKLTNMKIFDKDERIIGFTSIAQYFQYYHDYIYDFFVKRQINMTADARWRIEVLEQKIRYVAAIIEGTIHPTPINGEPLDEETVIKEIEGAGLWTDFYKSKKSNRPGVSVVTYSDLSIQGQQRTAKTLEATRAELAALLVNTPQKMWLSDLTELRTAYIKLYGDDSRVITI